MLLLDPLLTIRLDDKPVHLGLTAGLDDVDHAIGPSERHTLQLDLGLGHADWSGPHGRHIARRERAVHSGRWVRLVQGAVESQRF